ncbi:putative oxidoreductase [Bradyrhizobium ivorense]|uniref:Oxidoreductase n=1 Tax=Bradyrhizobium ivorense TaxID=2511166 RepID=A0A508STU8_9BRAD|nr:MULTISPECIES: SDR family NAD(P)-dependent oxidoreductase [Bradyrhizobium]MCC8935058.1 SDR family NAD(P)-dependent oxidoreductase [Bradyrhizobium ivorense]VIO65171.1 putative oxidoreductase [Bradyrhizobium ivorense]VIO72017.1 putative oxidoreductase [Bradyrhizobium ivorense]
MSRSLENMTALVTGASSGIGRATASVLARSKARVVLIGRRQSVLEKLAMECGSLASAYPCDMTDDAQLEELAKKIQADFARIDALIHSSGIIKLGRTETAPVADFDAQYVTNVRGPYILTQLLLRSLRAASGQIVFVNSSITRASKTDGRGTYAATQQAMRSIANALRDEVNEAGVRVTTIFPGTTATQRQVDLHEISGKRYDPDRMLQPEDVAEAVLFALTIGRTAEITDLYLRPMLKPLD